MALQHNPVSQGYQETVKRRTCDKQQSRHSRLYNTGCVLPDNLILRTVLSVIWVWTRTLSSEMCVYTKYRHITHTIPMTDREMKSQMGAISVFIWLTALKTSLHIANCFSVPDHKLSFQRHLYLCQAYLYKGFVKYGHIKFLSQLRQNLIYFLDSWIKLQILN